MFKVPRKVFYQTILRFLVESSQTPCHIYLTLALQLINEVQLHRQLETLEV
jgi:hypothetical protein